MARPYWWSMPTDIRVRLHEPTFGDEEIEAAVAVLRSTYVTSGDRVREFETLFGDDAVMCNSGSSANLLAIAALCNPMTPHRMQPGAEVIVSALSWATTVWPLVQHGLTPVIVDIDPGTLCIDPEAVKAAICARTDAILPVHVYGNPCDMAALKSIAADDNLWLVEDCCEALGAAFDPRYSGDIRTYSFYFSHHVTTLEGGLVQAGEHAEIVRMLRAHGWIRDLREPEKFSAAHPGIDPKFLFVNAGYNLRSTELSAAIGLVQMGKLPLFVDIRRAMAARLCEVFAGRPGLRIQRETIPGASSWFGFPVLVEAGAGFEAGNLRAHLESAGIETRSIICGNIARQPGMALFPHRVVGDLRHADHVMRNGFSIGCHQRVTEADCEHVGEVLDQFYA